MRPPHVGWRDLELFYQYHCYHFTWVGGNWNCSIDTIVATWLVQEGTGTVLVIPLATLHLDRRELELFYLYHGGHFTWVGGNWNCSVHTIGATSFGKEGTGTILSIPWWPLHLGRRVLLLFFHTTDTTSFGKEGTEHFLSIALWPLHLGRRELELFYLYHWHHFIWVGRNCSIYIIITMSLV